MIELEVIYIYPIICLAYIYMIKKDDNIECGSSSTTPSATKSATIEKLS